MASWLAVRSNADYLRDESPRVGRRGGCACAWGSRGAGADLDPPPKELPGGDPSRSILPYRDREGGSGKVAGWQGGTLSTAYPVGSGITKVCPLTGKLAIGRLKKLVAYKLAFLRLDRFLTRKFLDD